MDLKIQLTDQHHVSVKVISSNTIYGEFLILLDPFAINESFAGEQGRISQLGHER
jgi:hypothetical protein